jgi:hypothetical protein
MAGMHRIDRERRWSRNLGPAKRSYRVSGFDLFLNLRIGAALGLRDPSILVTTVNEMIK